MGDNSEAKPRHDIDLQSIDLDAPPPAALAVAGESAMLWLGLSDATAPSISFQPWYSREFNEDELFVVPNTLEHWAMHCVKLRHRAQRHNRKSERHRDRCLNILVTVLIERPDRDEGATANGIKRESPDSDEPAIPNDIKPRTTPPPFPWARDNVVRQLESKDWLEYHSGCERASETQKDQYQEFRRKVEKYRTSSLVAMTRAYICALKALEVATLDCIWGKQFG
ncbi:hypothetical protein V8F33_012474 [Rhypophila sp. PSN 637]